MCNSAIVHRDALRGVLVFTQEVASELTQASDANGKMAEQVDASRDKVTLIINQAFEQLHQTIEERKKSLLQRWRPFHFLRQQPDPPEGTSDEDAR